MILAPATLGVLGGGQLGRFFVSAAHELGYQVNVFCPDKDCPAGKIADHLTIASYDDYSALTQFAKQCAAITTEFENIPAKSLAFLAKTVLVAPCAQAVQITQNRILEKAFFKEHHIPHGDCIAIHQITDLPHDFYPAILKTAHSGYDGKGQVHVFSEQQAKEAFVSLNQVPCILEKRLPLDKEISIILSRNADGHICAFQAFENYHHNGILDVTISPTTKPDSLIYQQALDYAHQIATHLNYIGTLAVEFFIAEGKLYANEIAPRPHNSGHLTLDASNISQYELQVRAMTGLPIMQNMHQSIPAVMVNLLGDLWFNPQGQQQTPDWSKLLRFKGLKLHLYGKTQAKIGRKMGHFTVIGQERADVLNIAQQARDSIGIKYACPIFNTDPNHALF